MAINENELADISALDQAARNLAAAYAEQRPGAADAAIRFYASLQSKGMTNADLVNYRDLGLIAITEADKAHLPGAQDAAAKLYAAILSDARVASGEIPKYQELVGISNRLGVGEELLTSTVGSAEGSAAFVKQVVNTPSALIASAQKNYTDTLSGKSAAMVMVDAYTLAQDPSVNVEKIYHAIRNDGANMDMDERHARAALYRLTPEDRVKALKAEEWQRNLNIDSMVIGIPAAKATPGALRGASLALNALDSGLPEAEVAGIGRLNIQGVPIAENDANSTVMSSTGSGKGGDEVPLVDPLQVRVNPHASLTELEAIYFPKELEKLANNYLQAIADVRVIDNALTQQQLQESASALRGYSERAREIRNEGGNSY